MRNFFRFIFFFVLLILGACEASRQPLSNEKLPIIQDEEKPETSPTKGDLVDHKIVPLLEDEGEFYYVIDWYNNETILYITEQQSGSSIYKYHIFSGEKELFYETEEPLVTMNVNKQGNLFLLHTSPSTHEAKLRIIDDQTTTVFEHIFPSSEIEFSWNQENDNLLIVTSFAEDWTFETFLIDTRTKSIGKNPLQIPFLQWMTDKELAYLKWDEEQPELSAPMYSYNLELELEKLILDHVVEFKNFPNNLQLTIQLKNDTTGLAEYQFRNTNNEIFSFENKLLSLYSGWVAPYNTIDISNHLFYTFVVANDQQSFHLLKVDLVNGSKEIILEDVQNEPIIISSDGRYMLYGNRYERIISLKDKKVQSMLEVEK